MPTTSARIILPKSCNGTERKGKPYHTQIAAKDEEDVYVQHDDGPGTELDKGSDNYGIFDEFAPADGETAYKYYNEFMWPGRYAQTVSVEEMIIRMRIYGQERKVK